MQVYDIWLSPPVLNGNELAIMADALATNWISTVGEHLIAFESLIASYLRAEKFCALQSGTAAIHLALKLLNIQPGDEVICPTLTFVATANPILYEQAKPIFVDSEPNTWNLSPEWLEIAIQDRLRKGKKVRAIIVVHLYGVAADMPAILRVARKYEIPVIEDAAEALGAQGWNQKLGTLAELGVLSFNGNKIITTSSGGGIICNTAQYQHALYLATQAKANKPFYEHEHIGFNYRMSNILAALGIAQLHTLPERIHTKRIIFQRYQEALEAKGFTFPLELPNTFASRWLSTFLLPNTATYTPEDLRQKLQQNRIEARRVWKPLHRQPIFQHLPFYGDHTATAIFERGICLPSGTNLTIEQQQTILQVLMEIING